MASPGAPHLDWLAGRSSLDLEARSLSQEQQPPPVRLMLGPPRDVGDQGAASDPGSLTAALLSDEVLSVPLLALSAADDAASGDAKAGELQQPASAREEAARLLKLALPLLLQGIAAMLLTLVTTIFVGHLNDPLALSAVVLSCSLYNVSGMSITIGLSSAMDTLCGQAYGAKNYRLLGIVQQRARYICWTACLPIAVLWLFAEPVLVALGQAPDLAHLAAVNMRLLIPSLFLGVVNDTTRRYLVCQRAVLPTSVCYLTTTALSPLYSWLLIFRLNLGAAGAALALVACTGTNTLLLSVYQAYRDRVLLAGSDKQTWTGYSWAAFRGWRQYLRLGLPAAAMICGEWWLWEVLIFLAGLLPNGTSAVGVMGLCIQITNPAYQLPSSMGSATSVRVSNLLGAGQAAKARMATRVAASMILCSTILFGAATYAGRHQVVRIFTEDAGIRAATAAVVPAVAASLVGDGMVAVLSSVLRASGRQALGALFNLLGYWGLCLPLAWLLGFHLRLGVLGFWLALSASTALQAAAFATLVSRFDWRRECARARELLAANSRGGGGGGH